MSDFHIRSESVDVEQIMQQIRSRIREKRGVDYTEDQVRELAAVRLEKFLDPKNLRSDLLEQFRRSRPAIQDEPVEAPYEFSDDTLFASHRGPLRFIRRLLRPILKLFFNPNTLNHILHTQAQFNLDLLKRDQRRRIERADWNVLYYEVLHNLVLETTRNAIEMKNLKMRVEALASRLDFSERRVRALEGVVQYRPETVRHRPASGAGRPDRADGRDRDRGRDRQPSGGAELESAVGETPDLSLVPTGEGAPHPQSAVMPSAPGEGRRRRRRRRGRRSGERAERGMPADNAEGSMSADNAEEFEADASDATDRAVGYASDSDFVDDNDDAGPDDAARGSDRDTGGSDPDKQ
jgi:hypothetical protein